MLATTCSTTRAVQEELGQADPVTRPAGVAALGNELLHRDKHWQHMDNSSSQLPVPITSTHTHASALVVSAAVHSALQCTAGTTPLPPASAAPGLAEHPSWDSAPKDRN